MKGFTKHQYCTARQISHYKTTQNEAEKFVIYAYYILSFGVLYWYRYRIISLFHSTSFER